jgi:adenosine kinase
MSSRIAVCGSMAYDFISPYEKPFEQVLLPDKLSMLSVCFLVKEKVRRFGGTGGNIAYSLSLLEEPPALIGAVGYDFDGYKKHLTEKGVDLSHIQFVEDTPTASAVILTDPKGNQISVFHPGAMETEAPDVTDTFTEAKAVIIAPDDPNRMMKLVREAKKAETPYFFDPGQNLPVLTPEQLIEASSGAHALFLNDYEFEMFKKKTHLDLVDILERTGVLFITRGEEGSEVYSREFGALSPIQVPVVEPQQMVDPTGCGDAYRAGVLKGYLDGLSLETCAKMGALMATYVVEQVGTQNHTPNKEHFYNRYEEAFGQALK